MPVLKGTVTGSIRSIPYNIPSTIKSICLYNRSGGSVTATIAISVDTIETYIKSFTIASLGSEYLETNILVPKEAEIVIASSGSLDYYLTIE